jgi:hypothetical protein
MNTPDAHTEDPLPAPQKPTFILSFLSHYSSLLVVFVVLVILGRWDAVTYFVGPVFYLIEMMVACMVAAAFIKHAFFRSTIDTYTQNLDEGGSEFVQHWNAMSKTNPDLKVALTVIVICVLFLGAALIGANIVK